MRAPHQNNDDALIYVILFFVILLGVMWWFGRNYPAVHAIMMAVSKIELYPISFVSAEAKLVREFIASKDPAEVTTSQAMAQLGYAGKWYSYIAIVAVIFMGFKAWTMSATDRFKRSLSMNTLLENNRKTHPCIAPILNWPGSILDESAGSGPWMTARQPIQFVAEQGLFKSEAYVPAIGVQKEIPKGGGIPKEMLLGPDHLADPHSPVLAENPPVSFDRVRCYQLFRKLPLIIKANDRLSPNIA
jgi:hypothetical protein